MKKFLLTMTAAIMAVSVFTACGSDDDSLTNPNGNAPKEAEAVDLGLKVKWANMNIGATTPEGYGDYFAWGETKPYYAEGHSQDNPCINWIKGKSAGYNYASYFDTNDGGSTFITYAAGKVATLQPNHDAAHVNWKGIWRMPTQEEFEELIGRCKWEIIEQKGVYGNKITGPNGNFIFLPAAGLRIDDTKLLVGGIGRYWTSSFNTNGSSGSLSLYFSAALGPEDYELVFTDRYRGLSVRAVCEK